MPFSLKQGKDLIKNWFGKQTDIKTIVDLGAGSGTYPKLLGKKYIWKAVEIWGPYIEIFNLKELYQEIRIGDIRYMELPNGDCCIAADVLEHLEKKDAIEVIKKVDEQFKHAVFLIPIGNVGHTEEDFNWKGNSFERHISIWSFEELEKIIPSTYKIRKFIKPNAVFMK